MNVLEGKTYNESFYVMVCRAEETNKNYEPYKQSILPIPQQIQSLNGYGLGINEDIYNYIDFERKVYVQNCKEVNLGSLDWIFMDGNRFRSSEVNNLKMLTTRYAPINAICDNYKIVDFNLLYGQQVDKVISGIDNNRVIYVVDKAFTDAASLKASLTDTWLIYELETPIETDISDLLNGNSIEVQSGGIVTLVNEYNYNTPSEISFYTTETPEKVIVADKFVGDVVNTVEKSKSLEGLESTIEELNYLKGAKGNIQDQIDNIDAGSVSLTSLGITATAEELNYVDGVKSNIQTQLDEKPGKVYQTLMVSFPGAGPEDVESYTSVIFNDYYNNIATGECANAEGSYTEASGRFSHAEGYSTKAKGNHQHVQGRYNIEDVDNKYAHIVGNGNNAGCSNAHTLDWEGNGWYAGEVAATSFKIGTGCNLVYDSTNKCVSFQFI